MTSRPQSPASLRRQRRALLSMFKRIGPSLLAASVAIDTRPQGALPHLREAQRALQEAERALLAACTRARRVA